MAGTRNWREPEMAGTRNSLFLQNYYGLVFHTIKGLTPRPLALASVPDNLEVSYLINRPYLLEGGD